MNNLVDTNNMCIPNLGSSMNYNNIFSTTKTMHIQRTQYYTEMDQANVHEIRQDRSTIFEPIVISEVSNGQSVPKTTSHNIRYRYNNKDHVNTTFQSRNMQEIEK